ncbi:MAG: hypothetical protein QOI55_306 [Actinomycetota bacterium]|jgi:AcrR family transcriptional regulator|nr:hypothetical protein [Actinomycetota bacterium]
MARPRTISDDEIVAATVAAIEQHGPGLTLAEVAAQAGVSAAALVQRFGSKHALLVAVGRRAQAGIDASMAAAVAQPGSPTGALLDLLAGYVAGISSPEVLANHVAFLQLDLVDEELREQAKLQARAVERGIRRLLDAAVEAGELGTGVDTRRIAEALHTAYNGALVTWALAGRGRLGAWVKRQVSFALEPYLA